MRVGVSGAVADFFGVEDRHVGSVILPEHTAVFQAEDLRRQRGHRADSERQRYDLSVERVMAQLAREGPVIARVRNALALRDPPSLQVAVKSCRIMCSMSYSESENPRILAPPGRFRPFI